MTTISVTFDTREFTGCLNTAAKQLKNNLRSAVDRSARSARREALAVAAIDENVSLTIAKRNMPTVRASDRMTLSATWLIPTSNISIMRTASATFTRGVGLHASTDVLTGGGSADLNAPKAFTMGKSGKAPFALFVRTVYGKGSHNSPKNTHAIAAELTSTGMKQSDAAPRRAWERKGAAMLETLASQAVQKAFDGVAVAIESGDD